MARARIIVGSADQLSVAEVAKRTGIGRPAAWRWQRRFAEAGVGVLLRDATRRPGKAALGGPDRAPGSDADLRRAAWRSDPLDRPGEKPYEELFDREERRLPALVGGVLMAASQPINLEILRRVFDELVAASLREEKVAMQHPIQHLLPGYQPGDASPAAQQGKVGSMLMARVDRILGLQSTPT